MLEDELKITASLAMLEIGDTERISDAVSQMLEYFSKMMEIDVNALEPTTHALTRNNRVRDDVKSLEETAQSLLDNAPRRDGSFFKIPNVL
ncbi:MAG: Asp-tRNA(Asn)/Glu-tRNA(Gln) amidotransferase subunit GatC [Proteobacteria bacterium]|nr:Asp-tRNA(Asn)/Glu-tRNA(Gln) amidotransferase subunit GatC [Pseudomonadota bacterium]